MQKLAVIGVMLALSACIFQAPSRRDIAEKSIGLDTKRQLLAALGGPDDAMRLGPIERWTYKARDGDVMFIIFGNQVTLQSSNDLLSSNP